jgi:hypothetical protein
LPHFASLVSLSLIKIRLSSLKAVWATKYSLLIR